MSTTESELRAYRAAYQRGAAVFADEVETVDDEYWLAFSGASHPDYNMVMVQGGDVRAHAARALERFERLDRPGVVFLAGEGLAAGQVLADAGWVVVGAMPLMRGLPGGGRDASVRPGTVADLPAARALAQEAFGLDEQTAAVVYSERVIAHPGVRFEVVGEGEEPACVSLTHQEGPLATNWALATARSRRRRGAALAMMVTIADETRRRDPEGWIVGIATAAAEAVHRGLGGEVCEYWQVWSRPRWMLGSA